MEIQIKRLVQEVLSLAREAGDKILAIYEAGAVRQQDKQDGSPLTAADLASHHTTPSSRA